MAATANVAEQKIGKAHLFNRALRTAIPAFRPFSLSQPYV